MDIFRRVFHLSCSTVPNIEPSYEERRKDLQRRHEVARKQEVKRLVAEIDRQMDVIRRGNR